MSIFRHEMKPGKEDLFEKAKSAAKRLRTLRHPNILTFVDSMEVCIKLVLNLLVLVMMMLLFIC